ncbi:MAG: hypothetical protein ACI91R_002425 [Vicingaceae bacterium]|jgi:hypothetical protein
MNTHADKTQKNKSQTVTAEASQMQSAGESTFQFVDNRPESVAQRKLQEMANSSPQVSQLRAFQDMANNSPKVKQTAQLQSMADNSSSQQQPIQKKENNTGLPDNLKTGMENLSGMSLDDVKVHHNSDKPAQLQAHAYAQGTDIHLGSGQEKHLPHEAWHVIQQKQGRVKPTMQMKGKANINDDAGLEKEADVMGVKALTLQQTDQATTNPMVDSNTLKPIKREMKGLNHPSKVKSKGVLLPIQRVIKVKTDEKTGDFIYYSNRDPDRQTYVSLKKADKAELELKDPNDYPKYDKDNRPSTAYSYAASHPTNELSVDQGPHVVGSAAVDTALTTTTKSLSKIFAEQILIPDKAESLINEQFEKKPSKTISTQIFRLIFDYTEVYRHVQTIVEDDEKRDEALQYIKWLINNDPRSSTNWATKLRQGKQYNVPESKKKGKGENDDISDPRNIDTTSADKEEAEALWELRKKILPETKSVKEKKKRKR